ncbi:nucleoside triphosphate pyrophosphatase [Psychrobium sp. 1_MG-2023]|uniref:Maf family protein n=1 Tax=Psychrobium sp. 1_MG-2023 TaxID=3062624 RepID=UPI000C33E9EA|nr:Maf family protein [Psychrobium sp. 1_MG-2023]MDP2560718.1 Maf family protein [Psychrobium sp. 1_MG-2023]PKF56748.1 hypothetical protein CW748_09005 [Alteromonadales bacterium alter-6D02]
MNNVPHLYLASKSPRRRELLGQLGIEFELIDSEVDETPQQNEQALDYVRRLAIEKAQAGFQQLVQHNEPCPDSAGVLGADTIVVIDQEILGKPKNQADAVRMLLLLSNRTHQVMTAIAIAKDERLISEVVITDVSFREISIQEANDYWLTGEPADKAGGYGIQGIAGQFIENINGSYFAVVGLPLMETQRLVNRALVANQR